MTETPLTGNERTLAAAGGSGRLGRRLNGSAFILVLLSFLMPFITVTCRGDTLASLSGTDLVFGTTVEVKEHRDARNATVETTQEDLEDLRGFEVKGTTIFVGPEPLAIILGLLALVGLVVVFSSGAGRGWVMVVLGAGGLLALLLLGASLASRIDPTTATTQPGAGFFVAFLGYVVVLVSGLRRMRLQAQSLWRLLGALLLLASGWTVLVASVGAIYSVDPIFGGSIESFFFPVAGFVGLVFLISVVDTTIAVWRSSHG